MTTLVVGWDSYIDELGWGIGVAKGDNWDVNVGSLLDSLSIGTWVGNNDEAGFLEGSGDVIGEVTRGETTSDGNGTSVGGELQDGTLTVRTSRDNTDISWVVDGCDDTGSKDDLLPVKIYLLDPKFLDWRIQKLSYSNIPGLANVNNIDSIWASLPEVWLHVNLQVLGSQMALSGQKLLNILGGRIENRGELRRCHLCDLMWLSNLVKPLEDGCRKLSICRGRRIILR